MKIYEKSHKLDNVCYDIRGPVMDEAARIADRILVLKKGRQEFFGTPENLFSSEHEYLAMRLDCPCLIKTMLELAKERPDLNPFLFDVKEAAQALVFGKATATSTGDCRRVSSSDEVSEEVEES